MQQQAPIRLAVDSSAPVQAGRGSVPMAAITGGRRVEGRSEDKGQGEGGVCVERDTGPPGSQSSQHRASHFSPITLSPCLPPPCHHDPCACACLRWWPNLFFYSSGSSCGQSTIPISSSTSAESSLSASSAGTSSTLLYLFLSVVKFL